THARRNYAPTPIRTASPRRTSGPGSAVPARVPAPRSSVTRTRCWRSSRRTKDLACRRSSCPATHTPPNATCSPATCCHNWTTPHCFSAACRLRPMPHAHPEPFTPRTTPAALEDLRARLRATRWPDTPEDAGWSLGTDLAYLRELV